MAFLEMMLTTFCKCVKSVSLVTVHFMVLLSSSLCCFLYFKAMTDSISEQKISVVIREHRVRISGYAAAFPAGWFRFLLNHPNDSSFGVVDLVRIPLNENRRPGRYPDRSAEFRVSRLKFENHVFVHFYLLWFVRTPNSRGERPPEQTNLLFILFGF